MGRFAPDRRAGHAARPQPRAPEVGRGGRALPLLRELHPGRARPASAPTCKDVSEVDGDADASASARGHRASTSITPTCTAGPSGPPPPLATGSGSPTSCRRGGTSSTHRVVWAVGGASPGAPSASTSPRRRPPSGPPTVPRAGRTTGERGGTCTTAGGPRLPGGHRPPRPSRSWLSTPSPPRPPGVLLFREGSSAERRVSRHRRPRGHRGPHAQPGADRDRDGRSRATWSGCPGPAPPFHWPIRRPRHRRGGRRWGVETGPLRVALAENPVFGFLFLDRLTAVVLERLPGDPPQAARPVRHERCSLRPSPIAVAPDRSSPRRTGWWAGGTRPPTSSPSRSNRPRGRHRPSGTPVRLGRLPWQGRDCGVDAPAPPRPAAHGALRSGVACGRAGLAPAPVGSLVGIRGHRSGRRGASDGVEDGPRRGGHGGRHRPRALAWSSPLPWHASLPGVAVLRAGGRPLTGPDPLPRRPSGLGAGRACTSASPVDVGAPGVEGGWSAW